MKKKGKVIIVLLLMANIAYGKVDARMLGEGSSYLSITLKEPGKKTETHRLTTRSATSYICRPVDGKTLPVVVTRLTARKNGAEIVTVKIKAEKDVYISYGEQLQTGLKHNDCQFYMPGFWYRRNLRSPKEAPSFHTSDSWTVREDRLSTPLVAAFCQKNGKILSVVRKDRLDKDVPSVSRQGEILLDGRTSIGYVGFENLSGQTVLSYGYPYKETPKSYIRKLTLAPATEALQLLHKGGSLSLCWEIKSFSGNDYSDCIEKLWQYSYDMQCPQPLTDTYDAATTKNVLSNFFKASSVGDYPLAYYSGVGLETATCRSTGVAEIGFVGRILLNAFNALEYGDSCHHAALVDGARKVLNSYLKNGFTPEGLFKERMDFFHQELDTVYSVRRQSEGAYAILYYLDYKRKRGEGDREWEKRIQSLLDKFLLLQRADGSFPRKFNADLRVLDNNGGGTPSAILPLMMAAKYFGDKRYMQAAEQAAVYMEKELINKADYFSSTLDANCEDKEAAIYASTAAYYLALSAEGKDKAHYVSLARQAAYFALSWYYTWDVPFAENQMFYRLGLKTRGWGNVSVENNHIDVFVFEFADVLRWLSTECHEPRFSAFAGVISSSMRQLLPFEGHMCGIAKTGFYPEVVQHTNWDYGKNGKGFYNDIFAPGWTVASLWALLTPGRAEEFFKTNE